MRLGWVVYGSLDEESGGFRYDRKLVEGLRERGHRVEVVALPWDDYARSFRQNFRRGLVARLSRFDALFVDELCHPSLVLVLPRVKTPAVAVVHHLKSSEPRSRWWNALYRAVERRFLSATDAVVCNSETTRATVAALADRSGVVAPPAGDRFVRFVSESGASGNDVDGDDSNAPAFESRDFDGRLELCFVGNLVPRKGLHVLLAGLARVDGDWRLTVVGNETDPAYVTRIRRQRRRFGLDDRVELTGRLPDDAVAERLAESHLLAVPSLYEGFGLVYLEAMAFGLPVLATTAGGATELVTHGETGVVVPPDDPGEIARVVQRVHDDRNLLRRLGGTARARFEAQPGWEEATDEVDGLLRKVVEA